MIYSVATLLSFLAVGSASFNSTSIGSSNSNVPTVPLLDLQSYEGHWFQMYDNVRAEVFTPKDSRCVTADYTIREDGKVGVHNYGINKEGTVSTINGAAYVKDAQQPGQLTLQLDGVPFDAEYWVLNVGPINAQGLYDWALVSTSAAPKSSVYVLARNVQQFRKNYEQEVLELTKSLGFEGPLNKPKATYQENDCVYDYSPNSAALSKVNPPTVPAIDLESYVGVWFQIAADAIVMNTFEKNAFCVTAKYGLKSDGTLSVHNADNVGAATGPLDVIDGYAYGTDKNYPGRLKVHFDTKPSSPVDGDYWILDLGPVNVNTKLYDWAIVSDNLSSTLFVLARDVQYFNDVYRTEVYAKLTTLGFTGRKAPIDTYHGSDCKYEA